MFLPCYCTFNHRNKATKRGWVGWRGGLDKILKGGGGKQYSWGLEHLLGFPTGKLLIHLQPLNPLGHSPEKEKEQKEIYSSNFKH